MMKCSVKQKVCSGVLIVTGSLLIAAGVVLLTVGPGYIRTQIIKRVQLKNGSQLYDTWRNPEDLSIYMQFYIFDLKNTAEVLNGERPVVKERGPYTYREHVEKKEVTRHANGTISFRQYKQYHFVPGMSVGSDNETFVTVNMVTLTLLTALKYDFKLLNEVISWLLKLDEKDRTLFREYPVRSYIWGYQDPLLWWGKLFFPSIFTTDRAGIFEGKNNSDDGLYNIFTGEKEISKLGVIDRYNGAKNLKFWTSAQANMINGTDGTLCPPFVKKDFVLYMFVSDICRSVYSVFHSKNTIEGIPVWRFAAPKSAMENATVNPSNAGFCTPEGNCLGTGLLNMSTCKAVDTFDAPIVASFPHFFQADPMYAEAISGMHPEQGGQEYNTYINLEPHTGIVMEASKRLQINMHIEPIPEFQQTDNIRSMMYPVVWINESMKLDKAHANTLKNQLLIPLMVVNILQYIVIGLGGLCIIGCAAYAFVIYRKGKERKEEPIDDEPVIQTAIRSPLVDNET